MKNTITTITLAILLTFGTVFANAGIIVEKADGTGSQTCSDGAKGTFGTGIIVELTGIIVERATGIIVEFAGDTSKTCTDTRKTGIIVERTGMLLSD